MSGPLYRGGIADLPVLRTLFAIRQKSQGPSFWEVIDSFVLLRYASLAAWRTLLQWLTNMTIQKTMFIVYLPTNYKSAFITFNYYIEKKEEMYMERVIANSRPYQMVGLIDRVCANMFVQHGLPLKTNSIL